MKAGLKLRQKMGLIGQMSSVAKGSLERFFYWWGTVVTRHPYKDATFLLLFTIYSNQKSIWRILKRQHLSWLMVGKHH